MHLNAIPVPNTGHRTYDSNLAFAEHSETKCGTTRMRLAEIRLLSLLGLLCIPLILPGIGLSDAVASTDDVGLALVAGLTAAMMVAQMTVLQTLDGGTPRYMALGAGVAMLRSGFGCLNFYVLLSFSATSTVTKGG